MSEDTSPYCSPHDEWLIMKLCMYVGYLYHDANNVYNFGGHPIDDFRGACAVKGYVQVVGRTSSVSTMEMLSTHDVTLRNVDGSLFHVQI